MDLKTILTPSGTPDAALINVALAQMAKYYSIPSSIVGGWVDSKVPDAQTTHEKTLTILFAGLAGANIIFGAGCLETGNTLSLEQIVIDNEIWKQIAYTLKGFEVSDEVIGIDIIKKVGIGGTYLGEHHTLNHMFDFSESELFDKRSFEDWDGSGGKDLLQRAHEKVEKILKEHKPDLVLEDAKREMAQIIKEAENRLL